MSEMKIALFKVDVTPPVGAQMAYDINKQVDTPIYIRGLILDDGHTRAVVVSCDFIGIYDAWHQWRSAVADAAQTCENHVLLHSIHQHDSMRIAPGMNEFLKKYDESAADQAYCKRTLKLLCEEVKKAACSGWIKIEEVLTAEKRMSGLASNRRMLDENGKCFAMRFSQCSDHELQSIPVGTIDPLLRTVAFAGPKGHIAAALHSYASHPMAAYRREMVGQDVPGVALKYAEVNYGQDVFNIYITGCAGNVTFGKYHLGDKEKSLEVLGKRLGKGLVDNLNHLEPQQIGLAVTNAEIHFPFNPVITEHHMMMQLDNGESRIDHLRAARGIIIDRNKGLMSRYPLTLLSLGNDIHILSLQGEVCVEYQLYAQSLVPEHFLACVACGNGMYAYIPTADMYEEGGYEPKASTCTPEIEQRLKGGIAEVLQSLR